MPVPIKFITSPVWDTLFGSAIERVLSSWSSFRSAGGTSKDYSSAAMRALAWRWHDGLLEHATVDGA